MVNMNPLQLILSLRSGGSPQTLATQIIKENFPNDPTMTKLLQMGQSGDTQGIENFAKQYFEQQGTSLDKEMSSFLQMLKGR